MRFSLKWMLGAVAFVAFGCVALYNESDSGATKATLPGPSIGKMEWLN